jgi:hypothetical protein
VLIYLVVKNINAQHLTFDEKSFTFLHLLRSILGDDKHKEAISSSLSETVGVSLPDIRETEKDRHLEVLQSVRKWRTSANTDTRKNIREIAHQTTLGCTQM